MTLAAMPFGLGMDTCRGTALRSRRTGIAGLRDDGRLQRDRRRRCRNHEPLACRNQGVAFPARNRDLGRHRRGPRTHRRRADIEWASAAARPVADLNQSIGAEIDRGDQLGYRGTAGGSGRCVEAGGAVEDGQPARRARRSATRGARCHADLTRTRACRRNRSQRDRVATGIEPSGAAEPPPFPPVPSMPPLGSPATPGPRAGGCRAAGAAPAARRGRPAGAGSG